MDWPNCGHDGLLYVQMMVPMRGLRRDCHRAGQRIPNGRSTILTICFDEAWFDLEVEVVNGNGDICPFEGLSVDDVVTGEGGSDTIACYFSISMGVAGFP